MKAVASHSFECEERGIEPSREGQVDRSASNLHANVSGLQPAIRLKVELEPVEHVEIARMNVYRQYALVLKAFARRFDDRANVRRGEYQLARENVVRDTPQEFFEGCFECIVERRAKAPRRAKRFVAFGRAGCGSPFDRLQRCRLFGRRSLDRAQKINEWNKRVRHAGAETRPGWRAAASGGAASG